MGKWLTILAMLLVIVGGASAKDLELVNKAGDYEVALRLARNPPVVGEIGLTLKIIDSRGKSREDARVFINYYMSPMPRMAPMHFSTDVKPSGGLYRSTLRFIMAGPWVVAVKITFAGKTVATKFNIDVL